MIAPSGAFARATYRDVPSLVLPPTTASLGTLAAKNSNENTGKPVLIFSLFTTACYKNIVDYFTIFTFSKQTIFNESLDFRNYSIPHKMHRYDR